MRGAVFCPTIFFAGNQTNDEKKKKNSCFGEKKGIDARTEKWIWGFGKKGPKKTADSEIFFSWLCCCQ